MRAINLIAIVVQIAACQAVEAERLQPSTEPATSKQPPTEAVGQNEERAVVPSEALSDAVLKRVTALEGASALQAEQIKLLLKERAEAAKTLSSITTRLAAAEGQIAQRDKEPPPQKQPVGVSPGVELSVSGPLAFGKPTVKRASFGGVQVLVEATNRTKRAVTCTVTATFKQGDSILTTANGVVSQCGPGATRTVDLESSDFPGSYDSLKLDADACF